MTVVLNSRELAAADRVEVIHDLVCSGVLPVEIAWDEPSRAEVMFRVATSGRLNFSSAVSHDNQLDRTQRQARADHPPHVFLAMQLSGSSVVTQGPRGVVLHPGDMAVYDSTKPYTVRNSGRTSLHYFQVPRTALVLPTKVLDSVFATTINRHTNDHAAVIAPFFRSLGNSNLLDRPNASRLIAEPAIELFRALIVAQAGGIAPQTTRSEGPAARALVLSVQQFVHDHLGDHDLGPARIAAAHHVSTRHLYATLSRAEISLHGTIQELRLQKCRHDLADPRFAHLAVATIGARWGFVDPSHFGRVFKRRFGSTPYAWRTKGLKDA